MDFVKHLGDKRGGTHSAVGAAGMTTKLISRVWWPTTLGPPWASHRYLTRTTADAFHSVAHMERAKRCGECLVHGTGGSAACPRDSPRWVLGHLSPVNGGGPAQQTPSAAALHRCPVRHFRKERRFLYFSMSFCLFLNSPGLKKELGSPQLLGLCCRQSPVPWSQKPRLTLPFPRAGLIWDNVTARKGFQMRRCFSVWSNEIFNPCSLWDIHHHRFTYLLLTDSSDWQGRWQLTYINPAAQHKLSLQSRNPSLLFNTEEVSQLVLDTKCRWHLHWKVITVGVCWRWGAVGTTLSPSSPSMASSSGTGPQVAQHWGHKQGLPCSHRWPSPQCWLQGHTLVEENEWEGWTKITSLAVEG